MRTSSNPARAPRPFDRGDALRVLRSALAFGALAAGWLFAASCGNVNQDESVYPVITRGDLILRDQCPGVDEENVSPDAIIILTFNKEIDPGTANSASVILGSGREHVRGRISAQRNLVRYIPLDRLQPGRVYELYVTSGLRDADGFALTDSFVSYVFTTGQGGVNANTCRQEEW